jgi:putative transcriptional regulator
VDGLHGPVDLELPERGRLLVANPRLPDPNFDRAVVLLLACNEDGALGVVLNRPSDMLLSAPLPGWESLAAEPAVVFVGGPVQHQAAICLAQRAASAVDGSTAGRWQPVTPDLGTLDLELDPYGLRDTFGQVRVFSGYAGWSPGQLDDEIEAGAWWVVDAEPGDAFSSRPGELWKRVLRRQGSPLALLASYPDDPNMN